MIGNVRRNGSKTASWSGGKITTKSAEPMSDI